MIADDTCRVKLLHTENDYVNASYMYHRVGELYHSYIGAQVIWYYIICLEIVDFELVVLSNDFGKNRLLVRKR